ncbi:hypothetical protein A3K29_03600 [Candidatus Collierbacteria bacterium RIFOXYB2_FULL_46_14]|uniref:Uncharacterized protein n=1 Tax=Candidatus Collierbacteria bacterium GW2011_GWA2_46_26 TaxID=1618381 RepID=A0A0G1PLP6_9BACT|nr:MAG: hypothetical protein UW29_C0004G0226 [Candidatus Collierbacteria bacterium GW2011_GWC2_44_13]KKU33724.1 MAG: hypothetical protein UX47_C0001G0007 [Candidatus Collierbacteria bacterium GW2011_GWA2_46_26]OGD73202.1 MAG: hypothetical protein A3K29_03600 [Candidatus Collierbacteria bacterium RIFOXYB2_FULL_46_14]OGD76244.1 MAG: hypothetical protein A3K43_03600 [Candidatus Collierbacteria bacterium RIFOXYA2_FULL_46_20]OGD77580.1 MAG: hypothetical protein A3K39_03600 [Candidatus Collierbacteri
MKKYQFCGIITLFPKSHDNKESHVIILNTVYPCKHCKQEVDSNFKHCPECGEAQDHSGEEHFNIFKSFRGGGVYNMTYGATILTWEDIVELAKEQAGTGYFIGSFIPAKQGQEHHIQIVKWIPVVNGEPGLDQGAQNIEITNLE